MPSAIEFLLVSCQATAFTPEEEVSSAKIVGGLIPQWASLFDGDPVVLPFPGAVPREVPRVILQDKTGMWRCEIASARINIFWRRTGTDERSVSHSDVFPEMAARLVQYQEFQRARVGRLAGLVSRFVALDSPGEYLARHFCHERWLTAPLNRPEGFELHAHKRYELSGFRLNSWVRNKTAELAAPEGQPHRPIVLVEQDLNTFPEDEAKTAFSPDAIRRFFDEIVPEFDRILGLYYPKEG